MPPKESPSSSLSNAVEIPPIITIPNTLLTKKQIRKNDQSSCKLLGLPRGLMLEILERPEVGVYDIACLMLTCKEIANLVLSLDIKLTLNGQLRSENEAARWNSLDDSDAGYEQMAADLDAQFAGRVHPLNGQWLLRRLDMGWNTSQSRLCTGCELFVSTSKSYWEKKRQTYLFKSNTPAARGYRTMKDCACDCHPDSFIDDWIKYGKRDGTKPPGIRCPDCRCRETSEYPTVCDRCCDMSDPWDHDGSCGCSGCYCRCCNYL